jgi:cytochrome c oxidase assembly protein subunit 15
MFWVAMSLLKVQYDVLNISSSKFMIASIFVAFWIFLTIVSGGFVAGLDAGLIYNTFPLMDGHFFPDGLWSNQPWYINLFENITTVQFDHRILAEITLLLVVGIWWAAKKSNISISARKPFQLMVIMVFVQVALGIITLLLVVPVFIASLHQIGALVLFTFSIWSVHNLMYQSE